MECFEGTDEGCEGMLQVLRIRNLAVVEDAEIVFDKGLNVMTGSTGAGKSIILTAVDLLSGSRAKRSLLRKGAESLSVEGIFFDRRKIPETISIKREVASNGKSRVWINGKVASNLIARELTGTLLELHGQHRHQELLDPSNHIFKLDGSGGYSELINRCNSLIEKFKTYWKLLDHLRRNEKENSEREDFLRFQLCELDALKLEPGIDIDLEMRIKKLENLNDFASALKESGFLISYGDESILDKLSAAERAMDRLSSIDDKWGDIKERISEMMISLNEITREIESSASGLADEPQDIEDLQNRLAAIQRASRKFNINCDGLIKKQNSLSDILKTLKDGSDDIIEVSRKLENLKKELLPVLEELSLRRKEHAGRIDIEVTMELQSLGMKGALFRTDIDRMQINAFLEGSDELDLTPGGWDSVEFMIRTNVGEEIHSLSDVASGGELSRITLILKRLLVRERGIPTLIFDEVDSGLGADLGAVVADKMRELSERYQIICITHLPQVAAVGNQHILIRKSVKDGRTITTAMDLKGRKRTMELARMLGGVGDLQKKLASELLSKGKSARSSAG